MLVQHTRPVVAGGGPSARPSPAARLRLPNGGGADPRPHDTVATGVPEDGDGQEYGGGFGEGDKFDDFRFVRDMPQKCIA